MAVGLDGRAFGSWTESDGSWSAPATFGRQDPARLEAPYVAGLAVVGTEVAVAYSDGVTFRLAVAPSGDDWSDLLAPVSVPVSGDHQLGISAGGGRFLLVCDDGSRSRVWVGTPAA